MDILLVEDSDEKISKITVVIDECIGDQSYNLDLAKDLESARRKIIGSRYDLIVFDVFLPNRASLGEKPTDISDELVTEYELSQNYQAEAIALTQFEISELEEYSLFNQSGITLVHYQAESEDWKNCLRDKIRKVSGQPKYDFLIFCALAKERSAYNQTEATLGDMKVLKGLDCQEISIGDALGLCLKPPKMGLVYMAILAAKAIEAFSPKIVAMSGICAGVESEARLLDLVVAERCWEYQTGKMKGDRFRPEPYQSSISTDLAIEISQFIEDSGMLPSIKSNLYESELKDSGVLLAPMSSGSAVIASAEKMEEIGTQHRKMAGLEMEMYSMYEAASQSLGKPQFFGVKSVVDLGDSNKGDSLHSTGAILSARFVVKFLEGKLRALCSEE